MKPGEVRKALDEAARQLHAEAGAATWRDMAERAGVGYLTARRTVENMERAGALVRVGAEKRAHSVRWMNLYEPPARAMAQGVPAAAPTLALVVRAWPRG